jgi:hypothetical protein
MVRCIFCGEEIEGSVRDHMAEKHLGIHFTNGAPPADIDPKNTKEPEPQKVHIETSVASTDKQKTQLTEKKQNNEIPKSLNNEKPKRRYLNADEIITLLQNTNKQFPLNDISECPLTKENE